MYFSIDSPEYFGYNLPDLKGYYLFGVYERMVKNTMIGSLKLAVLTAEEVGQELGGN